MKRRTFIAGLGAAAWPVVARAQQPAMPVVGFLSAATEGPALSLAAAFRQGLSEQDYVEGRNVEILYRWAENRNERLPLMAADLVRRKVDVIFATAGPAPALADKAATATIPIVFQQGSDPVTLGLVASLNRPAGNITGIGQLAESFPPKRLELLHELVPAATTVAYLVNPATPDDGHIKEAEIAARALGVRLQVLNATSEGEIEAAFATLVRQRIGALMVDSDALFFTQGDQLAVLAARHALPASSNVREFVVAGGLMSYGASDTDAYRRGGLYVGRILKGAKPSELPVELPPRYELVFNLATAKALKLDIPAKLLALADEVIE